MKKFRTGIGQDSHRFLPKEEEKSCIVGGVRFKECPGIDADSDGDVIFHAICNAISSVTHVPILGGVARDLCRSGITDSAIYLAKALETLDKQKIEHIALTIEGSQPIFQPRYLEMRQSIATATKITIDQVGLTFTSGDRLTAFGNGEGLLCFCLLTTSERSL